MKLNGSNPMVFPWLDIEGFRMNTKRWCAMTTDPLAKPRFCCNEMFLFAFFGQNYIVLLRIWIFSKKSLGRSIACSLAFHPSRGFGLMPRPSAFVDGSLFKRSQWKILNPFNIHIAQKIFLWRKWRKIVPGCFLSYKIVCAKLRHGALFA